MATHLGRRSNRYRSCYQTRFPFGSWCEEDGAEHPGRLHRAGGCTKTKYCVCQIGGKGSAIGLTSPAPARLLDAKRHASRGGWRGSPEVMLRMAYEASVCLCVLM